MKKKINNNKNIEKRGQKMQPIHKEEEKEKD